MLFELRLESWVLRYGYLIEVCIYILSSITEYNQFFVLEIPWHFTILILCYFCIPVTSGGGM